MSSQKISERPKIAIVTNNYQGNAFLPGFITSLNSQTFLSFGDIDLIFVDSAPSKDVEELMVNRDNFNPNIRIAYIAPIEKEDIIPYGQGIKDVPQYTDALMVIKLDVDDRLAPYGAEIFYREFLAMPEDCVMLTGWELHTDCVGVPFDEIVNGSLFIPKKLTTQDMTTSTKWCRKSCTFGNIVAYNIGVSNAVPDGLELFVFEGILATVFKNDKTYKVIPEVIGSHTIHSAGLRHGIHNEEAMLSESQALVKAFKDVL